ncbi:hypothetical protein Mapa_002287 [Marchantia paleacea]|nr:hypothetical protein Mapa_002287 [Marchantia paleacea]
MAFTGVYNDSTIDSTWCFRHRGAPGVSTPRLLHSSKRMCPRANAWPTSARTVDISTTSTLPSRSKTMLLTHALVMHGTERFICSSKCHSGL